MRAVRAELHAPNSEDPCPRRTDVLALSKVRQILTVLSLEPVAIRVPFGLNTAELIMP